MKALKIQLKYALYLGMFIIALSTVWSCRKTEVTYITAPPPDGYMLSIGTEHLEIEFKKSYVVKMNAKDSAGIRKLTIVQEMNGSVLPLFEQEYSSEKAIAYTYTGMAPEGIMPGQSAWLHITVTRMNGQTYSKTVELACKGGVTKMRMEISTDKWDYKRGEMVFFTITMTCDYPALDKLQIFSTAPSYKLLAEIPLNGKTADSVDYLYDIPPTFSIPSNKASGWAAFSMLMKDKYGNDYRVGYGFDVYK